MRVTVFGASGGIGRHLIDQALAHGHHVTAFVRAASRLGARSEQLTVVVGDVAEAGVVASAVEGRRGMLCALGAASPLRRDATLVEGVRHIVVSCTGRFSGSPTAGISSVWSADIWLRESCCVTLWPTTRARGRYRSGPDVRAMSLVPRISRADLAEFMLGQLVEDTYVRKAPAIMY